jgi:ATP-dependent protease ClpP protease subunit
MFEIDLGGKQKTSVWDDYVPIVKAGQHTDVYLTAGIEAPEDYNQLCYILERSFTSETITLHINNGGGYIDSGFMIIDALKKSAATVTAKLTGTVASAATIIALACDKVEIADHTAFMIHNYSGGVQGKGNEMKAQMDFTHAGLQAAFKDIYGGFLTEDEMENVIADRDMWLTKREVEKRWKARGNKDKKGLEILAAERKGK